MTSGRHAAPESSYNVEEAAARLHAELLASALADIEGLSRNWAAPSSTPYVLDPATGTLLAILNRTETSAEDSSVRVTFAS